MIWTAYLDDKDEHWIEYSMTQALSHRLIFALVLIISGCSKPVAFQPAPEERAIPYHHSSHPQQSNSKQAVSVQPWIIGESASQYPFSSSPPHKTAAVPDFSKIKGFANRKRRFFKWLRPIAEHENQRVLKQRKQLLQIRGRPLNRRDIRFLSQLAKEYRVDESKFSGLHFIQLLLLRVDAVPTDLILAQAAIESAWGKSRFSREGNNLFGEWCYRKGCGLVPKQRKVGASHEVRFFASPALSVRAYLHNINRGKSYNLLRQLRRKERQLHQPLSGYELALGLRNYSELGMKYVRMVRSLIKHHTKKTP